MAPRTAPAPVIPFVGAALPYRRKYYTASQQIGGVGQGNGAAVDVSPTGNKIFAYGWLRSHTVRVSATTAASTGGTIGQFGVPGVFNIVQIRQPGGQEMFGGPNFSGWHAYLAQKYSAWRGVNDPFLLPSFSSSVTSPSIVLRQIFELNHQTGLGALPNQNDAAPWQAQFSLAPAGGTGGFYSTVPTTTNPTFAIQYFVECWTVPSPQNPLRPNVRQQTAPPLAGTLNKWTVQQVVVPGGSAFDVTLVRKGNSIRSLAVINFTSANALLATSNSPDPMTIQWDGQVVRANDAVPLLIDDDYMTRLGAAQTTPETADVGVLWLKNTDLAGIDVSALGLDGLGMARQWGTTQTSTITIGGTWGATVAYVQLLTNDVQYVLPSPNPYAARSGEPFLQNMAQPSAVT
jgi:hypothetical protein